MSTQTGSNTASIGFEQQIWAAADILRGNMDAAEYKHVVLGLIFLKYISDKFDERYHGTRDFLLCVFCPYYAPNGAQRRIFLHGIVP